MIHTFEITHRLSAERLQNSGRNIWDSVKIDHLINRQIKELIVAPYEHYGINELTVYPAGDMFNLRLVVNPQSLILQQNTISIFDCTPDAVRKLKTHFENTLVHIGFTNLPPITEWWPKRVDFAIDVKTDHVAEYVALAKTEKRPPSFVDRVDEDNSVYPECNSVSLHFYDIADQVKKKLSFLPDYIRLLEEAQTKFRVEVQCRTTAKLKGMQRRHYPSNDLKLHNFLNPEIAIDVVVSYYRKVMGFQNFYNMAGARRQVTNYTGCCKARKIKFLDWLSCIVDAGTLPDAKAKFLDSGGSKATWNNYMALSREIDVNPITIPADRDISFLTNPLPMKYRT